MEILSLIQPTLSFVALLVSVGALVVSFLALRQSRNTSLLNARLEAIGHIRSALSDIEIQANIGPETVHHVREAYQLSSLVFGGTITNTLEEAFGIVFRLQLTKEERWTDKHYSDRELLLADLKKAFAAMKKRAAIRG
jgi:hypothetical protein